MTDLNVIRKKIDVIDLEIIKLLNKRYELTHQVGEYKAQNNMSAVDKSREAAQKEKFTKLSKENGLNENVIWTIFKTIIDDVVKNHIKIAKQIHETK